MSGSDMRKEMRLRALGVVVTSEQFFEMVPAQEGDTALIQHALMQRQRPSAAIGIVC